MGENWPREQAQPVSNVRKIVVKIGLKWVVNNKNNFPLHIRAAGFFLIGA